MFIRNPSVKPRELLPGATLKTLTWGNRTMLTQFNLQKGVQIPIHQHPHDPLHGRGRIALRPPCDH